MRAGPTTGSTTPSSADPWPMWRTPSPRDDGRRTAGTAEAVQPGSGSGGHPSGLETAAHPLEIAGDAPADLPPQHRRRPAEETAGRAGGADGGHGGAVAVV